MFKLIHILFPGSSQGAVGLAIWVPSVVNQPSDSEPSGFRTPRRVYSSISPEDRNGSSRRGDVVDDLELSIIQADISNCGTYNEEMLLDDLKVSLYSADLIHIQLLLSRIAYSIDILYNA